MQHLQELTSKIFEMLGLYFNNFLNLFLLNMQHLRVDQVYQLKKLNYCDERTDGRTDEVTSALLELLSQLKIETFENWKTTSMEDDLNS